MRRQMCSPCSDRCTVRCGDGCAVKSLRGPETTETVGSQAVLTAPVTIVVITTVVFDVTACHILLVFSLDLIGLR